MRTSAEGVYLDASALVKLVATEDGSSALASFLSDRDIWVSSALARVEVVRAARRYGPEGVVEARRLLADLVLLPLDADALDAAADLDDPLLRSLDAIHVAAARSLGPDLVALVSYDARTVRAATALGLPVASPA